MPTLPKNSQQPKLSKEDNTNESQAKTDLLLFEEAIRDGDLAKIKKLLSNGFYVNQILKDLPPLSFALSVRRFEMIDFLISSGADVCQMDILGKHCPMFYAINRKCPIAVIRRLMLAGARKDDIIEYDLRRTALHWAVHTNQKSIIKYLLSLSVNVDSTDVNGYTPLHIAVQENHPKIIKLLVQNGAELNVTSHDKFTPLMFAIRDNNPQLVRILLSLRSDVNYQPEEPLFSYQTPLNYAVVLGHVHIMEILLSHGADAKSCVFGESLLHTVSFSTKLTDKSLIQDAIELLINHGADLNSFNNTGYNPLHTSIFLKKPIITKYLLKVGSSVTATTKSMATPLHLAAEAGDPEIVKLLLSSGADLTVTNDAESTPYDLALTQPNVNTVRVFWSFGWPYDDIRLKSREKKKEEIHEDIQRLLDLQEEFLHAVETGDHSKVLDTLNKGAEPKGCRMNLRHPLHFVVIRGFEPILHELLQRGVQVCSLDQNGETPLQLAAKVGNVNMCIELMSRGACYNYRGGNCKKTPYQLATKYEHENVKIVLNTAKVLFSEIKNEIQFKSLVNIIDIDIVKNVFFRDAFLNCVDRKGYTLLTKAVSKGLSTVAEFLMSYRLKHLKL